MDHLKDDYNERIRDDKNWSANIILFLHLSHNRRNEQYRIQEACAVVLYMFHHTPYIETVILFNNL